jgi:undecaprenyl-diphosphatase
VLIVLIGLSRVHAGAHWVSDVLGGWLLGIAWLLTTLALYQQARRDRRDSWQERSESTG